MAWHGIDGKFSVDDWFLYLWMSISRRSNKVFQFPDGFWFFVLIMKYLDPDRQYFVYVSWQYPFKQIGFEGITVDKEDVYLWTGFIWGENINHKKKELTNLNQSE